MIFASVMPLAWKAEPDARIAEMMETEKAGAVEEVRALIQDCQLTEQNVFPASGSKVRASWPCPPPETGATRIGRSKPPNWIRQERQAIPDRKGQKLGGVQPIHQARRCAPSLGGASSPLGACAPGAFSLEIDLPNWTVGLEAWRSASEPPARLCAVTIPIECSELNKKENGVGWRRIRQRRQSKKPNQINDKCRKSSTGQHVAHVRGAHDGLD